MAKSKPTNVSTPKITSQSAPNVKTPNKPMPKTRLQHFIAAGGKASDFCSAKDSSGLFCK